MADEAQASTEQQQATTQTAAETTQSAEVGQQQEQQEQTSSVATEDDGEPGGRSPLEVARRKEYERRVKAEAELEATRGRLEELKQQQAQPTETETKKGYTKAELEAAVLAGNISAEDAEDILFAQRYAKVRQLERQAEQQQKPLERARTEVQEFVKLEPALRDGNSEIRQRADDEMDRLVGEYGFRRCLPGTNIPDPQTQRQAIENVLGRIDVLRTRKESERMTRVNGKPAPTDTSAGGGGGTRPADVLAKVPKDLVDGWRSMGATEEQIRRYAQHHQEKVARRQQRAGF